MARHCHVHEKSLPDAFPLRKAEGGGNSENRGARESPQPSIVLSLLHRCVIFCDNLTMPFPGYTEREGLWLGLRPLSRRWRLGDGFACGITSQGALNNRVVNPKIRGA